MAIYDISEWQGNIDFTKHKNDNFIARVQAGSTHKDKLYDNYAAQMKANGISFGSYSYFKGISVDDSIQEAKDTLSRMSKDSKFFALDIEEVTMTDLVSGGQAYVNYLRQNGVEKIGLYSGEYFYKEHGLDKITGIDFLWLAKYGVDDGQPHEKPSVPCQLWQYTSKAKIDGIPDNFVDVNLLNGDKPLSYFFGEVVVPKPVPAPPKPEPVHQTEYIVQSGDNITFIAKKYGVSVDAVVSANHLANGGNLIYPGQKLVIPNGKPQPSVVHYIVRGGDNLTLIAHRFGTTVQQIIEWNNITRPDFIQIGEVLRVK